MLTIFQLYLIKILMLFYYYSDNKLNEIAKLRNSLPLVDLCRDRRRRISSIKRSSTENISRNEIAYALKSHYSVQKTAKPTLMPTWAKFSLSWVYLIYIKQIILNNNNNNKINKNKKF